MFLNTTYLSEKVKPTHFPMDLTMYFPLNRAPAEPESVRSTGFAKQTSTHENINTNVEKNVENQESAVYLVVVVDLHPGLAPVARGLLGGLRVRHGCLGGEELFQSKRCVKVKTTYVD